MANGISKTKHVATRISLFKDWYKIVFPINRFLSRAQTLHLRNGVVAHVGDMYSSDVSVLIEIFATQTYQLQALHLRQQPIVVDVGANIGAFSLAVRHLYPEAHIVAYEPSPRNFELLAKNIPAATLEQKALSGSPGAVQIEARGTFTALKLINEGGISIPAITLDDALATFSRIDLLKVDIEGAEDAVFDNASSQTLAKIDNVIIEIHHVERKQWYVELFESHGLKTRWLTPDLLAATKESY